MKLLLVGLWITLVALGTAYGVALYGPGAPGAAKPKESPALQYTKSRVLNVPMIAGGVVQGFMTVQLGYTVDAATLKGLNVSPEIYLVDEAFRSVYSDPSLDFRNLAKYDLTKLTAHLAASTNERLGAPVVKDVMIEQFVYVSKDTMKG